MPGRICCPGNPQDFSKATKLTKIPEVMLGVIKSQPESWEEDKDNP